MVSLGLEVWIVESGYMVLWLFLRQCLEFSLRLPVNPHMALWWPALDSSNDICPAMLEAVETRKQCCEGGRHNGYFVINVNDTSLVGAGR